MEVEPRTLDFWTRMNQAVQLLSQYTRLLDGLEANGRDVSHYRSHLARLHEYVYMPDVAWSTMITDTEAVISAVDYDRLRTAADALHGVRFSTVDLDTDSIIKHLGEALEVAHQLPPGAAREQLMWLVGQAIYFAQGIDRFGTTTVEEMTTQVVTRMDQIATDVGEEVGSNVRERAGNVRDSLTLALYTTITTEVARRGLEGLESIIKAITS